MKFVTSTLLISCLLIVDGCGREQAAQVSSAEQLENLVGRRVELVGVVSNTTAPQILGVDLWGMEKLAGQSVRVSGVLQRTVITMSGDHGRAIDSGQDGFALPLFRGAGTYYRLQEASYVAQR